MDETKAKAPKELPSSYPTGSFFSLTPSFTSSQKSPIEDEGSLYSIPEDSREDIASEPPSRSCSPSYPTPRFGVEVELSFVEDPAQRESHIVKKPARPLRPSPIKVAEKGVDSMYSITPPASKDDDRPLIRWKILTFCFITIVIVLSVFIAINQSQANQEKRSRFSDSITADDKATATPPVAAPVDGSGGSSPSVSPDLKLVQGYVYSALSSCPGDKSYFESETNSGRVFASLVQEVNSGLRKDKNNYTVFDPDHGFQYLQEKFALSMLYLSTNGANWTNNENWLSDSDPCGGWNGVSCQVRKNGTCAVNGVSLDKNNLSGELPKEFCCIPCLRSVHMANNNIGGPVLTCLINIPSLDDIDFVNNHFTAGVEEKSLNSSGVPDF